MSLGEAFLIGAGIQLVLIMIMLMWHQKRSERLLRDAATLILQGEEQARAAIAQELHDDLAKRLYDLQLRIANRRHIDQVEVGGLVEVVRQTARQLHPRELGPGGFPGCQGPSI